MLHRHSSPGEHEEFFKSNITAPKPYAPATPNPTVSQGFLQHGISLGRSCEGLPPYMLGNKASSTCPVLHRSSMQEGLARNGHPRSGDEKIPRPIVTKSHRNVMSVRNISNVDDVAPSLQGHTASEPIATSGHQGTLSSACSSAPRVLVMQPEPIQGSSVRNRVVASNARHQEAATELKTTKRNVNRTCPPGAWKKSICHLYQSKSSSVLQGLRPS